MFRLAHGLNEEGRLPERSLVDMTSALASTRPYLNLVLCCCLAASGTSLAQSVPATQKEASQGLRLRVDVNLVTVGVRVTDGKNREATGLRREDFSVYEDGRMQTLSFFSGEQQPLSLGILLDKSYSMGLGNKLEHVRAAALALFDEGHPDNEWLFMAFDHAIAGSTGLTRERERVKAAIARTISTRSGSSHYDALLRALERLSGARHPRQALVVFTDGADQHSQHGLDDVIQTLQASEVQVYLIGYFDPKEDEIFRHSGKTVRLISGKEVDNPRFAFKRLAEESGAACFFPRSVLELRKVVETISNDLRHQYTLAYYSPQNPAMNRYRKIEVKVNRRGLRVRARPGYLPREMVSGSLLSRAGPPGENSTPPSAAPSQDTATVVYREDFSTPNSGWPNRPESFYAGGEYHIVKDGTVAAQGPWLQDFRASLRVRFLTDLPSRPSRNREVLVLGPRTPDAPGVSTIERIEAPVAAGLVFRLNERGYYALLVSGFQDTGALHYKVIKKEVGLQQTVDLLPWTTHSLSRTHNTPGYHLSIDCRRDFLQISMAGEPVRSLRDSSFRDGMVGMILVGKGHAVFDDLTVEEVR